MVNKIWNSILLLLIGGTIVCIILNEISYDRFSRFDYYLRIDQIDNVSVKMLENKFYTKDDSFDIASSENDRSVQKQLVPQKLYLLWFNFNDDKFYEFNGVLPSEKISKQFDLDNDLEVRLGKSGTFQLIINDKFLQEFNAKEVSKP